MKFRIQIQQIFGVLDGQDPYSAEWLECSEIKPRSEADGVVCLEKQATLWKTGAPHRLVKIGTKGEVTVVKVITVGTPFFTPAQQAAILAAAAPAPVEKVVAPGVRFGVRMTGPDGVFMKDMTSQHWTTSQVRDMTRKEADDVVAYELTKGTCSTYEVIDLDELQQVTNIRSAAAKAVRDSAGYDGIPWDERKGKQGAVIRMAAMLAADRAEALARA